MHRYSFRPPAGGPFLCCWWRRRGGPAAKFLGEVVEELRAEVDPHAGIDDAVFLGGGPVDAGPRKGAMTRLHR